MSYPSVYFSFRLSSFSDNYLNKLINIGQEKNECDPNDNMSGNGLAPIRQQAIKYSGADWLRTLTPCGGIVRPQWVKFLTYVIRNADIRLIFTRLRTDLNALKTCKINTDINKNCPYGCNEQQTVAHLLMRCRKFDEACSEFVSLCAIPRYKLSNEHYMLKYILDLECPAYLVNACCSFI